ncbi:MAG: hypothetical protein VB125_02040 [Burkholderia sp.]
MIGKLYAAKERACADALSAAALALCRMVLGQIKALLDAHLETTLSGGKLGQALG